ncbi:MAG: class I SAM-dependent methyltransferase [Candidatus Glassbacteria bacterium]|nr:class I SAM-dependent methyltransferase [Candidatus Glassbacteria bacterium]
MKEISGDHSLNAGKVAWFLVYNLLRGLRGYTSFIRTEYIYLPDPGGSTASPGRRQIDRFFLSELPRLLPLRELDVLDLGCGSGYLAGLLAQAGYRGNYLGLDLRINDTAASPPGDNLKVSFQAGDIGSFRTDRLFDLVVSVSTLEHLADDRTAVCKAGRLLKPGGLQVHVCPAFWALFLYLSHGWRQYNPGRLKYLFGSRDYRVYRLGGAFSFLLHLLFITVPFFLFRRQPAPRPRFYSGLAGLCNRLDRFAPFCSANYVVIKKKEPAPGAH